MSDFKEIEDKIATTMINKIKSDKKMKEEMNNGVDLVVKTMEEVEKTKLEGKSKSVIAKNVIELIIMGGDGIIPEKIMKDVRQFLDSDLLSPIFTVVVKAAKGLINLNVHKKILGCFGC